MKLAGNLPFIRIFIPLFLFLTIPAAWGTNRSIHAADSVDFSLETLEGKPVHLRDYRGQKTVHLVFWSTWCPKCLRDMTKLNNIYKARGKRPYEILAINVGLNESKERIRKIQREYQIPFTILLDHKGKLARDFGVMSIPSSVIIDSSGTIADRFTEIPGNPADFFRKLIAN